MVTFFTYKKERAALYVNGILTWQGYGYNPLPAPNLLVTAFRETRTLDFEELMVSKNGHEWFQERDCDWPKDLQDFPSIYWKKIQR